MKKLVLPLMLATGVLYLVSGKLHEPTPTAKCTGVQQEKDLLLHLEMTWWMLEVP